MGLRGWWLPVPRKRHRHSADMGWDGCARSRRQESREDAAGGMARDTQIHRVN